MIAVIQFFTRYAPLIYLLLAMCALWLVGKLVKCAREAAHAFFGLEREVAQYHFNCALISLLLIFLLALGEFILTTFLAPALPAAALLPTATLNPAAPATATLSPEMSTGVGRNQAVLAPIASESSCLPDQIAWTYPAPGDVLRGTVTLRGTIQVENFGFYKYEYAQAGSDAWSTVKAGRNSGRDIEIGDWNTTLLVPGDYLLRLVVTDNDGREYPPCVVPVRVAAP